MNQMNPAPSRQGVRDPNYKPPVDPSKDELQKYPEQWVASIRDTGQIAGANANLEKLMEDLEKVGIAASELYIQFVPDPHTAL